MKHRAGATSRIEGSARLLQRAMVGGGLALVLLLAVTASVRGSQVVDQSYLPFHPPSGFDQAYNLWSGTGNPPMGQQFVPTLNSLNFVDLWLQDASSNSTGNATVQVNIRS